jgi:hypothetical protein
LFVYSNGVTNAELQTYSQANDLTVVDYGHGKLIGGASRIELYPGRKIVDRTPPVAPTVIPDQDHAIVKQVILTGEFAGDSVKNEYSLDKRKWQRYPENGVTVIKKGTVYFRSTDAAGNVSSITAYQVNNIDSSVPVVSAPAVQIDRLNVTITWQAIDDTGVTGQFIRYGKNSVLNGDGIAVAGSRWSGTLASGQWYYQVGAIDGANNLSWSNVNRFELTYRDSNAYHNNNWNEVDVSDFLIPANELPQAGMTLQNDEWVGIGDSIDFQQLKFATNGIYQLAIAGLSNAAKVTFYEQVAGKTGSLTLKTINTFNVTPKKDKSGNVIGNTSGTGANLLLSKDKTYYVSVTATGAAQNLNTDYDLRLLSHGVFNNPQNTLHNNTWNDTQVGSLVPRQDVTNEWVGFGDTADYYKLTMDKNGALTLNLNGLTGDANLSLLDSTGKVLKKSANRGSNPESIIANLTYGNYYVNIAAGNGVNSTAYTLAHTENYFPDDIAGNTFALAKTITASGSVKEWLGFGDKDDYYKIELKSSTQATFNLDGLKSNADLYLFDSKFKQLAVSGKANSTAENIVKQLGVGTYYVKATLAANAANTSYELKFSIDPTAFKSGSLQLFSASSPLTGSSDTGLTGDPLKKNHGMLAN